MNVLHIMYVMIFTYDIHKTVSDRVLHEIKTKTLFNKILNDIAIRINTNFNGKQIKARQ